MQQTIISSGNRAVVITAQGSQFSTRLYVNARNGIAHASATPISNTFKSMVGAQRWASKKLEA